MVQTIPIAGQVCSMTRPQPSDNPWMRSISFATMLRILHIAAASPHGLTSREIDLKLLETLPATRRSMPPARTTLYHHRNTLLKLQALQRHGPTIQPNRSHPVVQRLLRQHILEDGGLHETAQDQFAALVLNSPECRHLFFDLFLPRVDSEGLSVCDFRYSGLPVIWVRQYDGGTTSVLLRNDVTGRTLLCESEVAIKAVLYGLRYWARDELALVDEYSRVDGTTIMFPIARPRSVRSMIHLILSLRHQAHEWTLFSVVELIERCCVRGRHPIVILFEALRWLSNEWHGHVTLIPTTFALATLASRSPGREQLELRRYFRRTHTDPYVSHLRVHRDITLDPEQVKHPHVYDTAAAPAHL